MTTKEDGFQMNGQLGATVGEPLVLAVTHQIQWKSRKLNLNGAGKSSLKVYY